MVLVPETPVQERIQPQVPKIVPDKRQQDKIIATLTTGDFDAFFSKREIAVQENQREAFLQMVARGEIDEARFKELILQIKHPIKYEPNQNNPVELYNSVSDNKFMRGLIAFFVRGDFYQKDSLNPSDIWMFIQKYPTPWAFEKDAQMFLRTNNLVNSLQTHREYEASLKEFMLIVYGKRQEYYEQAKLLLTEAGRKYPELARSRERATNVDVQRPKNSQIEKVSKSDAEIILGRAIVQGDEFMGKLLTPDFLKDEGLLPKYKIRIGDSLVWFSSCYEFVGGRVAVVAYVEKQGKIVARSYYLSNSQGVWRYLPEYDENEGKLVWLGKGHGEESITLPSEMQEALSLILTEGTLTLRNPNFIFAGTAQKSGNRGIFYQEIQSIPRRLEGGFYPKSGKTRPEQISLSPTHSPDFTKLLSSWKQKTTLYGLVTFEVFPSRDGSLKFMFCRDTAGRVWIGGIEDSSEIQSTGLRRSWIEGGDLVTPAYEYKTSTADQTGGYGNGRMKKGPYVDMYEKYLRNIPVIQEYLKARVTRQP